MGMSLFDLPTLADRPAGPQPKGPTRLQETKADTKVSKVDEQAFKAAVWKRDKSRCRCCGRKVIKTLARVPNRGEVNHIHGRGKDLRFEDRAALLLCLEDHERVTGKVNEKLVIVPTKTFTVRTETYTDARAPVLFRKVV
jgi:hypothetical protein